ncbi:MAG: hypothetical protein ACW967_03220, partial [Candidatus Hodarchaeales archaeon]
PLQPFESFLYDFFLRTGIIFLVSICLIVFMLWYSFGYYQVQEEKKKQAFNDGIGNFYTNISKYSKYNFFALGLVIFLRLMHEFLFPQNFLINNYAGIGYGFSDTGYVINIAILFFFIAILIAIFAFNLKTLIQNQKNRTKFKKTLFISGNTLFYGIYSYLVFVLYMFLSSRAIFFTISRNFYLTQFPLMIIWLIALFLVLLINMTLNLLIIRNLIRNNN